MKSRCLNKNHKSYPYYGALGVIVCERWLVFENFCKDVGEPPSPEHVLDRYPNRNGNYEPGNVRWVTVEVNNRNKRSRS